MSTAIIKIDQAGLPAGTPGFSRRDGLATGALVTLTSTGVGTTHSFRLLSVPLDDVTSEGSLVPTSPTTATFSPPALRYGSWRIELIVDLGLLTEVRSRRTFTVQTPNLSLAIPAWNERADPAANIDGADGPIQVAASERNEPALIDYLGGDPRGTFRALTELYLAVDALVVGTVGHQTAAIIVGNAPAGDTLAICDFLDTGNCIGLAAALAAAGTTRDVYLRRGLYDLGAVGAPVGPLVLLSTLRGAGLALTTLRSASSGDQGVLVVGTGGMIRDLQVQVAIPVAATAGSVSPIRLGTSSAAHNVRVTFAAGVWGAGPAALLTIRAMVQLSPSFFALGHADTRLTNMLVSAPGGLRAFGVVDDLVGFQVDVALASTRRAVLQGCAANNLDIGVRIEASGIDLCEFVASNIVHKGVEMLIGQVAMLGGSVQMAPAAGGVIQRGVLIGAVGLVDMRDCRVVGATLLGDALAGRGLEIAGNGAGGGANRHLVDACTVTGFAEGVRVDPNGGAADRNRVVGNELQPCTTPLNDLGTNTMAGLNVVV